MKKTILIFSLVIVASTFTACSSSNDDEEIVNNFENADYIKGQMIGKWNYWGHKSPSCNCWTYNGDIYKGYFTFANDNKYTFKDEVSGVIQNGTFFIIPATKTENASLTLNYKQGNIDKYRFITLKDLVNNQAIIYETSYDQRYDKE